LEKARFYGDIDVENSYFGYTIDNSREKPTSSQFIAIIADHASLRAENDPLKTEVTKILHQLGVPENVKGYGYLRTAIMMAVKDPALTDAMLAEIYQSVAKEHQSNVGHVYRAILRAINIAWDRGDEIWYVSYFGYESVTLGGVEYNHVQKPTPGKFITVIANHINSKEH
jgi:two-component system response regulator (stage 0 sporulation protein A)